LTVKLFSKVKSYQNFSGFKPHQSLYVKRNDKTEQVFVYGTSIEL